MLKKTVVYDDFDGNKSEGDYYFNLSQVEIVRLELSLDGGLEAYINSMTQGPEIDGRKILSLFEQLIQMSFGVKTEDGKRFEKSPELTNNFINSGAYSALCMSLLKDQESAQEFFSSLTGK